MGYLLGVRSRTAGTDTMWVPLRRTSEMLSRHGVTVDGEIVASLDTLPAEWEATKRLAANVKESLGPHMAEQVDRILREEDEFRTKVQSDAAAMHWEQ
jgi:dynein heavy chain